MAEKIPVWCWYLLWLGVIICIYWPSIIVLPKRDHAVFMMGRHLVASDFDWFLNALSYNRTRLLQPGDYFAFRPVHMAILAVGDILARTNFVVQGLINCAILATAATMFCHVARRMAGILPACALTLLWVSQLAGVEIVLWQHINPYLLAPACMFVALSQIAFGEWSVRKAALAGFFMFLACLTHELCVMIACATSMVMLIDRKSPLRGVVLTTFVPAVALALLLNAIDYKLIHPPPSMLGPGDRVASSLVLHNLFSELTPLAGAVGTAFFNPDSVHISTTDEFSFLWIFSDLSHPNLLICAILVLCVIAAAAGTFTWQTAKHGMSGRNLLGLFFLLFFGAVFGVTSFRVLTRGIGYMYGAGYYFSLFTLALCGLFAYLLSFAGKRITLGFTIVLSGLAVWHMTALRSTLSSSSNEKRNYAARITDARDLLGRDRSICFAGMDPLTVSPHLRAWAPLFHEFSCSVRPGARPLYLSNMSNFQLAGLPFQFPQMVYRDLLKLPAGIAAESSLVTPVAQSPLIPFGYPVEFVLQSAVPYSIIISPENDLTYNFKINYNGMMIDEQILDNVLTWDATKTENTIQIQFTSDSIMLFGNSQLLSILPRSRTVTGKNCQIIIQSSRTDIPIRLKKFGVALAPTLPIAAR